MNHIYSEKWDEYNKGWATKNPELFTASVLEFVEQNPDDSWKITVEHTPGFLKIRAVLKA